jgi:hypothetical protein
MKGKPLNFDNLKEESSKIVQFANETTTRAGEIYNENRPKIGSAGDSFLKVLKYCLAIFAMLMAAGCFIGLFAMMFAYGSDKFGMDNNLGFYLEENNLGYLLLAIAACHNHLRISIFIIINQIILSKVKIQLCWTSLGTLGIIWIILIGVLAASASRFNFRYSGDNQDYENVSISAPNDTIYLDIKINIPENFNTYFNNIYSDKKTIYKRDYPSVEITRRDDIKTPYIIIKKEAEGYNQPLKMKVPVEIITEFFFQIILSILMNTDSEITDWIMSW